MTIYDYMHYNNINYKKPGGRPMIYTVQGTSNDGTAFITQGFSPDMLCVSKDELFKYVVEGKICLQNIELLDSDYIDCKKKEYDINRLKYNLIYGQENTIEDDLNLIKQGLFLPYFVMSYDTKIQLAVVEQGYGFDILSLSNDREVKMLLASKGYALDRYLYDGSTDVKIEVAKQGYGLDILAKDSNKFVRAAVAKYCNDTDTEILDTLLTDPDFEVRMEIAKRGYGLYTLIFDRNSIVKRIANKKEKEALYESYKED